MTLGRGRVDAPLSRRDPEIPLPRGSRSFWGVVFGMGAGR